MTDVRAHLNRLSVAVPQHEVHSAFVRFAQRRLRDRHARILFERMAKRSDIRQRWSCLPPAVPGSNEFLDAEGFYRLGHFPTTAARMQRYQSDAPTLAVRAVDRLSLGVAARQVTHLIVASCTGLSAPGVDFELIRRCNLNPSIERTFLGFMGCNAAINALKLARHIVRSEWDAKVLVVCVELCSLHLQESEDVERLLTFLLFADGCAAGLVSADQTGLALDRFRAEVVPEAADHITWAVGDSGFEMFLSGEVPAAIGAALHAGSDRILSHARPDEIDMWAVHPGGRTVLDAVERAFALHPSALIESRAILRDYGNMSSPTVLFVLEAIMRQKMQPGARGCAMAFGPGLTAETMLFSAAA